MIPNLLLSGLAGAALIALWVGNPLESTADADAASVEALSATSEAAPKVAAAIEDAPKVRLALATATVATEADIPTVAATADLPTVAAAAESPVPEVALVEVPDLTRMSAWEARKQLKKRGLGFTFMDGRHRVRHDEYDYYRVRKQALTAGTRVALGTKVTVQVRERQIAAGY